MPDHGWNRTYVAITFETLANTLTNQPNSFNLKYSIDEVLKSQLCFVTMLTLNDRTFNTSRCLDWTKYNLNLKLTIYHVE